MGLLHRFTPARPVGLSRRLWLALGSIRPARLIAALQGVRGGARRAGGTGRSASAPSLRLCDFGELPGWVDRENALAALALRFKTRPLRVVVSGDLRGEGSQLESDRLATVYDSLRRAPVPLVRERYTGSDPVSRESRSASLVAPCESFAGGSDVVGPVSVSRRRGRLAASRSAAAIAPGRRVART